MKAFKDFFEQQSKSYENDLIEMINENSGKVLLITGIILSFISMGSFYFIIVYKRYNCDECVYITAAITFIILITAIVCFMVYKSSRSRRSKFQNELILLRDLAIAMNIAENLATTGIKEDATLVENGKTTQNATLRVSPKTKMQEQIIQTLLNHYSN